MRIIGNILWLILGGLLVSSGLLHRRTSVLRDHHRDSVRLPVVEVRSVLAMAIRNRSCGRKQRRRLPQHIHECALDPAGVVGDRRDAPRLRSYLLHHHHRHPFRSPALQDGSPLAHPIRQDLQKRIVALRVSGIPRRLNGLFLRQNLKKVSHPRSAGFRTG